MVAAINPATVDYIQRQEHYNRLQSEKRCVDKLEDNRQIEKVRCVQEEGKGVNLDVMA